MPCRLRWVVWRVKWINVRKRDLYSNIIPQSIITRCSSSMWRAIFGWDTCRFSFSSEIQLSNRRGETRRWRWLFLKSGERGLQCWACLNSHRLLLLPAAAKLLGISLSRGQCWPWVELGLLNRGIPHFVATQTLSPWSEDQGDPQDRPQSFSALQVKAGEAESWFWELAWLSTPFHPGVLLENQMPGKERSNFKGLLSYMRSVPFPLR